MFLSKIANIYRNQDYLTSKKAQHIFVLNVCTILLSIFATALYWSKGLRPGYVIIFSSSLISALLILRKRFGWAVKVNLFFGLVSVTAGWFFGAKEGNVIFSISTLIIVFLYLSNIRMTILVSVYCFCLLLLRPLLTDHPNFANLISFSDTLVMYSTFAIISILTVHVIQVYIREKDLLIQEVHHRVRNNLQILSGLVELQKNEVSEETFSHLVEFQDRISALAKVHDLVYQSENYLRVDCELVLEEISSRLTAETPKKILFYPKWKEVNLSIDLALPLSLVFNEIVLTAIHRDPSPHLPSQMTVGWERTDSKVRISFIDSVGGLGKADREAASHAGSILIDILTRQLKGKVETLDNSGKMMVLEFPVGVI
ncbi:sensor histidine kinase [Leptospira fletcheri]|uniref:histidine kinase n=1 Tax=Leptospira fletcheri TaxID=2484981 RepID=A0A4R9GJX8_9LEPT|nr:sensor histidine kinase [Leptospira fletcheri]TGK14044.1 sensor histidine kinase [Leptospira fletcheri]